MTADLIPNCTITVEFDQACPTPIAFSCAAPPRDWAVIAPDGAIYITKPGTYSITFVRPQDTNHLFYGFKLASDRQNLNSTNNWHNRTRIEMAHIKGMSINLKNVVAVWSGNNDSVIAHYSIGIYVPPLVGQQHGLAYWHDPKIYNPA